MKPIEPKSPLFTLSLILLGLTCLILLYPPILQAFYKVPTAYNEGWNATHALAAMAGDNIYHYPDKYLINNYPPLSFYISGVAGKLFGDYIFPARALSVVSLFSIAILIFTITRSLTKQTKPALFSALLFCALMAANYGIYVGINDPQLMANAFSCAALAAFILLPTQKKTLLLVALLCLASGLIKHNLINVPIAISLFIFFRHRHFFIYWVTLCSILLGLSLAIILALYGGYFFDSFISERSFSFYRMFARSKLYLSGLSVPLAFFAATLLLSSQNKFNLLLRSYFFTSLITGIFFSGGAGVYFNIVFDVCIALSILCAINLHQLSHLLPSNRIKRDMSLSLAALALAISAFLTLPLQAINSLDLINTLKSKEQTTADDIAFLSEKGSPAICETMSLCYWAGIPVEYDAFNIGQAMLKNETLEMEILEKINSKHYSVIQLLISNGHWNKERFSESFIAAVYKNYKVARTNRARLFFIPKTNSDLATENPDGSIPHTTLP
jgi:4-amino-4-deoxy-L-arabinose transferase-like glycosyltransferase